MCSNTEEREPYDGTGRSAYYAACKRLHVTPADYFLRNLLTEELLMGYYGLGPRGARAAASVLGVSNISTRAVASDLGASTCTGEL